jgi:hypothetical protein
MGFYNFRCKKCKGTIVYTTIDGWRKVQDCNCKPQHPELLNLKALDKKEALRRSAFESFHESKCKRETTSGGLFTYSITPTAIGTYISIRCNACLKVKAIEDTRSW